MRSTPNRRTPRPLGLGRARFNRRHEVCSRYDRIHFVEEPLAASGFAILLEGAFSIYKRDWNLAGFAPSLRVTMTRNRSTVVLYHEKRFRAEIRLTRAF